MKISINHRQYRMLLRASYQVYPIHVANEQFAHPRDRRGLQFSSGTREYYLIFRSHIPRC
ncbi:MAG TPA: hypothetical protein VGL72_21825 [Bryobacteraceae bacterium]